MKGLILLGFASLLFYSTLPGTEQAWNRMDIFQIDLEQEKPEGFMAVSLPDEIPAVIPENPLALADLKKPDKDNKSKISIERPLCFRQIKAPDSRDPYNQIYSLIFQPLRFILFRNLRL